MTTTFIPAAAAGDGFDMPTNVTSASAMAMTAAWTGRLEDARWASCSGTRKILASSPPEHGAVAHGDGGRDAACGEDRGVRSRSDGAWRRDENRGFDPAETIRGWSGWGARRDDRFCRGGGVLLFLALSTMLAWERGKYASQRAVVSSRTNV